jgi:hypothetical protein
MPNHISLFDFVLNRVRCLVSFRILLCELNSNLWLCMPQGFDPRCGLARPDPARPSLGPRAPGARSLPMRAPPPLVSFSHLVSPAQQPLSHLPLSPRGGALGFGDGDRRIWTPR